MKHLELQKTDKNFKKIKYDPVRKQKLINF